MTTLNAPGPRFGHVAVWTSTSMLVRGGCYFIGDVALLWNDTRQRWYGDFTAAPPADVDQDGIPRPQNCDDLNEMVWSTPGEAVGVEVSADGQTLTWSPPGSPGGTEVTYDLLRTGEPSDFTSAATCAESGTPATTATDTVTPSSGNAIYYLVRARNACPGSAGVGSLGSTSNGTPRAGRDCP